MRFANLSGSSYITFMAHACFHPRRNASNITYGFQGSAGVGDPFEREVNAVREDVLNELVSVKSAREGYGVVIEPSTLEVDMKETEKLRKERS